MADEIVEKNEPQGEREVGKPTLNAIEHFEYQIEIAKDRDPFVAYSAKDTLSMLAEIKSVEVWESACREPSPAPVSGDLMDRAREFAPSASDGTLQWLCDFGQFILEQAYGQQARVGGDAVERLKEAERLLLTFRGVYGYREIHEYLDKYLGVK